MVHDPLRTDRAPSGQASDADDASADGAGERIAKLLARSGVGSRRDVERLIEEGRVAINGQVLTTPAVKVEASDIITVDGAVVGEPEPVRVFRYHKPVGLVTTHKDPHDRPTVFKALPPELPRLISVGRLDLNSEGLLLLTNDGGLARALELPSTGIVRRYRARAHGRITQDRLDKLKDGITVGGVRYGAIEARLDKAKDGPQGANLWLTVTLHEGKNREVRRVLEALGLKVNRLIRLSYGPFALGTLGLGEVEEVGPRVIREQLAGFILPENMPKGDRPQYRSPTRKSRRAQAETRETELVPPPKEKAKKDYKAGWAKPKAKAKPHGKGPLKGAAKGPPKALVRAKIEGKTIGSVRDAGPKPGGPAAAARKPGGRQPQRPGQRPASGPRPPARSGPPRRRS
ncbi:pseudouridine synthase [Phenylobacterium sp. J426]|uniref:pseudouridine synthase n=1 Tax=Phenylobacterium sp. J426 TaxID=2898439 RepID=UPI002150932F|nr:pseudouridine synthase [Phenylobacterium sp. J426]MCR5874304.1 pseudouridine synthase [Phenylobacterium sp. J426]